jgi:hypothetical protein
MSADFDEQVLRILALLFKSHPAVVTIDGFDHGTLVWLIRNGIVSGNLQESNPLQGPQTAVILSAQLPVRTLAILRTVESAAGRPLGQAAENAVESGNEREIRVVGELLSRRLSGA